MQWGGNGLADPSTWNATGAPAGTNITSFQAWALFLSGVASIPANLQNGLASAQPLALYLGACTVNNFPTTSQGVFDFYRRAFDPAFDSPGASHHNFRAAPGCAAWSAPLASSSRPFRCAAPRGAAC